MRTSDAKADRCPSGHGSEYRDRPVGSRYRQSLVPILVRGPLHRTVRAYIEDGRSADEADRFLAEMDTEDG